MKRLTREDLMLDLADSIKEVEERILDNSIKLAENERDLENKLLILKNDIANAEDDKGKPLYSNDMKRQAALLEMKESDSGFEVMEEDIAELRLKIKRDEIDLRYHKNLLDINKIIYKRDQE